MTGLPCYIFLVHLTPYSSLMSLRFARFNCFLAHFCSKIGHFRPRRPIPDLLQLTHKVNNPPSPQEVNVVSSRHTVPTKNTNIDPNGGRGVKDAELFPPKSPLSNRAMSGIFNRAYIGQKKLLGIILWSLVPFRTHLLPL